MDMSMGTKIEKNRYGTGIAKMGMGMGIGCTRPIPAPYPFY